MTNPETLQILMPSIQVLAQCIERSCIQYQLQHNPDQPLCKEAGLTLRCLVRCYTQVLCAALEYCPDLDDDCLEEEEESDIDNLYSD